jgi:hypothetical protein
MTDTSKTSDFSEPWTRATLLKTEAYVASPDFLSRVEWARTGIQNNLVVARDPSDPVDVPSKPATCAIVGIVSRSRLYLEPHGNFNPNYDNLKAGLEGAKTQFQVVSPTERLQFNADFDIATERLEALQRQAIKDGPNGEYFVVQDGLKNALRFSWPLFERRVRHLI